MANDIYYRHRIQSVMDAMSADLAGSLDYETILRKVEKALDDILLHAPLIDGTASRNPHAPLSGRDAKVDSIIAAVSRRFAVSPEAIRGPSRQAHVAHARHVAMYLANQQTTMTLTEIGSFFGARDHSTVIHAVKKIRRWLISGAHNIAAELEVIQADVAKEAA